jgi:drug/metabolite transporter (DMT)-like permease
VTVAPRVHPWRGLALGALGVATFSVTLPATRVAVGELPAMAVGFGRVVAPALVGAAYLRLRGAARPHGATWARLAVVASGTGVMFPLFSALALRTVPASHGAVVVGFNPIATAMAAVLLGGERPSARFWGFSLAGLAAVLVYAWTQGAAEIHAGDAYLLLAVGSVALSYAEGAYLSREMPGFEVLCWSLLLALPLALPLAVFSWYGAQVAPSPHAWAAFAYVSLVSQFLGLWVWYRGLAEGGVARVGQLQLGQPLLTMLWSAWLLGEQVLWPTVVAAVVVMLCGIATLKARVLVRGGRGGDATRRRSS